MSIVILILIICLILWIYVRFIARYTPPRLVRFKNRNYGVRRVDFFSGYQFLDLRKGNWSKWEDSTIDYPYEPEGTEGQAIQCLCRIQQEKQHIYFINDDREEEDVGKKVDVEFDNYKEVKIFFISIGFLFLLVHVILVWRL